MVEHGANGFRGDALAPGEPHQPPGEFAAVGQVTGLETHLAEKARLIAPFDRPSPFRRWQALDEMLVEFGAVGGRIRRTADEAAHLGIAVHRHDGVEIVEFARPQVQPARLERLH